MAREGLAHRLYTGQISYDFIGRRRRWYLISAAILLIALAALLVRGLNPGIEFRGGADFQVAMKVSDANITTVREAVLGTNLGDLDGTQVQSIGEGTIRVQTRTVDAAGVSAIRGAMGQAAGVPADQVTYSLVGASWGDQITNKGIQALIVFIVLVMLLIWGYFRDWKMSIAAIAALFHDLVLTIGIYALVGFTVTPATLIAVLTILGYSLYDTVVVFDKVRENVANLERQQISYSTAANNAINQVLVRSLNTTLIGVLPVGALLFTGAFILGTGPLEDLGLAMFVGMIAGAYSSIFIATPLLAQLREAEPGMKEYRAHLERRAERAKAKSSRQALPEPGVSSQAQRYAVEVSTVPVDDPAAEAQPRTSDPDVAPRQQPRRTTRNQRRK